MSLTEFGEHVRAKQVRLTHDLKPDHVTSWLAAHLTWQDNTRRGAITVLKTCINWGILEGHLPEPNPLKSVKKPPAKPREQIIPEDVQEKILAHLRHTDPLRDFLFALQNSGARPSEVARVTDVKDCEWIAQLLQHGLLKASFMPERLIRELRDLTRQRAQLVGEKASVANRIQKVLEDANIKLGSVASDVLGASGRDMLRALVAGHDSGVALANLARGQLRDKLPQLYKALTGRVTDHHRFLLGLHLEHLTHLETLSGQLDQRVHHEMAKDRSPTRRPETVPRWHRPRRRRFLRTWRERPDRKEARRLRRRRTWPTRRR